MAKKKTDIDIEIESSASSKNPFDKFYDKIGQNHMNQGVEEYISTGIMQLNYALSGKYKNGGFGVGRIHELYGGESSGKTMIATMVMANAQEKDGIAMFLDYEHSFDISRAIALGLSDEHGKWFYQQPSTAEEGFKKIQDIADMMAQYYPDKHIVVVVDSVAAMKTNAELESGFDSNMKTKLSLASCMSASLKQLQTVVSSCKMTLLFLNQTRKNPGISFGDPTALPGGESLKFYASTRTKLSKSGRLGEKDDIYGEEITAQTIKNKIYMPFKIAKYKTNFEIGVDLMTSHFEELERLGKIGKDTEYITKGGAWYSLNGEKAQGFEKFVSLMNNTNGAYEKMLDMFG